MYSLVIIKGFKTVDAGIPDILLSQQLWIYISSLIVHRAIRQRWYLALWSENKCRYSPE